MNGKSIIIILGILLTTVFTLIGYIFLSNIGRVDAKDVIQDGQVASILSTQGQILNQIGSINTALKILLPKFNSNETPR